MGADMSQHKRVNFAEVTQNRTLKYWETMEEIIGYSMLNSQHANCSTDGTSVQNALPYLKEYFCNKDVSILEIGSGNGYATKIVAECLDKRIIATDYIDHAPKYYDIISGLLSHDAVKQYSTNVLLMICPPPLNDTYMCYYAIEEFKGNVLVFIGELGAGDGEEGLYLYLMESDVWQCVVRKVVRTFRDISGCESKKELFIFERI